MNSLRSLAQQSLRGPLAVVLAVTLIAAGAGSLARNSTTAFFTSTANNTNNTFTTANLGSITGATNGAAAQNFVITGATPNIGTLVSITPRDFVPGDSQFGRISFVNTSGAKVTYSLQTTAAAPTTLTTGEIAAAGSGTDPMGLLVFRCTLGGNTAPCGTAPGAGSLVVTPIYQHSTVSCVDANTGAAATSLTLTAATAFSNALVATKAATAEPFVYILKDAGVNVTAPAAGDALKCVGGAILTTVTPGGAVGPRLMGGPTAVSGAGAQNAATMGLETQSVSGPNSQDHLAIVVYLPTSTSSNTLQNTATDLTFGWTMEQRAGTAR